MRFIWLVFLMFWSSAALSAPLDFQGVVLADEPILYYQLNESEGNAINYGSLGASHDAAYLGTPTRAAPTFLGDTGVTFNGAEDYLESLSATPSTLGGNPTFTAEAVVLLPEGGTANFYAPFLHWGESVGSQANRTGSSVYFSFSSSAADKYYVGFYNGGLRTSDTFSPGVWRHLVWVREGGNTDQTGSKLYVDGVAVDLQTDSNLCCNGFTPDVAATTPFRINRAQDFTRFFTGTLDEVALYDRALTAEEVEQHFQALIPVPAAAWLFLSGLGLLGWLKRRAG